jgi:hypothetical protein
MKLDCRRITQELTQPFLYTKVNVGEYDRLDFSSGNFINAYPYWPPRGPLNFLVIHYNNGDTIWGEPSYGAPDCPDFTHCRRATFRINPTWQKGVPQGTSDGHGSFPGAIRLECGPARAHRPKRYANTLLEQSHRAIQHRLRPMLGCKRFDSAARFCHAHDEVRRFFRLSAGTHRPVPIRWQRQLPHPTCTMLRERLVAACPPPAFFSPPLHWPLGLKFDETVCEKPTQL